MVPSFVSDVITVLPFRHHGVFKCMVRGELRKYLGKSQHITAFAAGKHESNPVVSFIQPAWILVGKPPRARPRACATGPPFSFTRRPQADVHAR